MIINNFAHDLFTGLWTSSILVIYLLRERARAQSVAAELHALTNTFFWLGIVSLAIVLGSGGIRFLYYKAATDGSERTRKSLLIAKHLLFTVIFGGGTLLAYRWTFFF